MIRTRRIYGLVDPRTDAVRYVGQTVLKPEQRLEQHLRAAGKGDISHRSNWIRQLTAVGLAPSVKLIEEGQWTVDQSDVREIHWIASFPNLTNMTPGGKNAQWYKTPEQEARRIASVIAYMRSTKNREHRRKLMKERYTDPAERAKVGEQFKAYWADEAKRAAHTEAIRAVWGSNEQLREAVGRTAADRWADPEYKKRVSKSLKKKWKDPQVRRRHAAGISAALTKAKQRTLDCSDCSFSGTPMAAGAHKRWTGHVTFVERPLVGGGE